MSFKILVAANLNDQCLTTLRKLNSLPIVSGDVEIEFIHIFETKVFFNELATYSYPSPDQYESIKANCMSILEETSKDIFPNQQNMKCEVFFHSSAKRMFLELVEERKPNLVVTTTHIKGELESIFTSSFTEYLINHAPSEILVLREPKDED